MTEAGSFAVRVPRFASASLASPPAANGRLYLLRKCSYSVLVRNRGAQIQAFLKRQR
jgi:hypothetical protein